MVIVNYGCCTYIKRVSLDPRRSVVGGLATESEFLGKEDGLVCWLLDLSRGAPCANGSIIGFEKSDERVGD